MAGRSWAKALPLRVITIALGVTLAGCNLGSAPLEENIVLTGAPAVRIVSPLPNATYLEGVAVNIQAQIGNAGADIDRVEVAVDNSLIATLPDPNTSDAAQFNIVHTWTSAGIGSHMIAVTAFRADGSSSEPATVSITVRADAPVNPTLDTGAITQGAVQPPTATRTLRPSGTPPPATATSEAPAEQPTATTAAPAGSGSGEPPIASFSDGINVRRGPGTNFTPPIGAFLAGQTTRILAMNLTGDWYKVQFGITEGWVYAPLVTVTGDTSTLPREAGPPTPYPPTATPIPPTAIPATAAPVSNVNLVAGIVVLDPGTPRCAETFNVGFDVANLGSAPSSVSSTVNLTDARAADGSQQGATIGGFPVLQPGETFRVNMPLTVSTWYGESHTITLVIDPGNQVVETNENDNRATITYTLDRANCP